MHGAINDICEKTGLKYDDYFKLLPLSDYSQLKLALAHTIRELSREPADKEQLAKKAQGMGASQDVSQVVATCVWVRREEIHAQLVKDTCDITQSKLEDFDWRLKVSSCMNEAVLCTNFMCPLYLCVADHVQQSVRLYSAASGLTGFDYH